MTSIAPRKRPANGGAAVNLRRVQERVTKARVSLVLGHPFFATLALHMKLELDDTVPTACTNGKYVKFGPAFVDRLTDEELLFVMAHEVMHPALSHNYRMKGREHRRWNMAGDYVINQLLSDEKIGKRPEFCLHDPALYQQGGGSTDGIYNLLPPQPEGGSGGQGGGGPDMGDDIREADDPDGSEEADMPARVAQAANAAKMAGKLSAGIARLVDEILRPKVDWRDVLQRFIVKVRTDQRTFARPNRRFASQGLYLPSVSGEALGPIVVAVDCSGSITADVLSQFAAEIRAIHEDGRPRELHVVYFDASVSHHDTFGPDDTVNIEAHGGGGTAFSPIFQHIDERGIEPVACVVLTDLYCADFGPCPGYPVLWVSNGASEAPWGEVVMM
jgi:predicted metal-dependent peptidase